MLSSSYLAAEGISSSELKQFLATGSPKAPKPASRAFNFGSYVHTLLLSPQDIDQFLVVPDDAFPTSSNQERYVSLRIDGLDKHDAYRASYSTSGLLSMQVLQRATELETRIAPYIDLKRRGDTVVAVTESESLTATAMVSAVLSWIQTNPNSVFAKIYYDKRSKFEIPLFGELDGIQIKGQPDLFLVVGNTIWLSDLKTINEAGPKTCLQNIVDFDYQLSLETYAELIKQNHGLKAPKIKATLLFVGKQPPHSVFEVEIPVAHRTHLKKTLELYRATTEPAPKPIPLTQLKASVWHESCH